MAVGAGDGMTTRITIAVTIAHAMQLPLIKFELDAASAETSYNFSNPTSPVPPMITPYTEYNDEWKECEVSVVTCRPAFVVTDETTPIDIPIRITGKSITESIVQQGGALLESLPYIGAPITFLRTVVPSLFKETEGLVAALSEVSTYPNLVSLLQSQSSAEQNDVAIRDWLGQLVFGLIGDGKMQSEWFVHPGDDAVHIRAWADVTKTSGIGGALNYITSSSVNVVNTPGSLYYSNDTVVPVPMVGDADYEIDVRDIWNTTNGNDVVTQNQAKDYHEALFTELSQFDNDAAVRDILTSGDNPIVKTIAGRNVRVHYTAVAGHHGCDSVSFGHTVKFACKEPFARGDRTKTQIYYLGTQPAAAVTPTTLTRGTRFDLEIGNEELFR
jgi:hypothetical protein